MLHPLPATCADFLLSTAVCILLLYPYIYRLTAQTLVPYFWHLAGLKWHEYDESALANPNRCKVKIGLMHEGSARAGIIVIGGIFR